MQRDAVQAQPAAAPAGAASPAFPGSRILTDWKRAQEQQRRLRQAEQESARVMASMRRMGGFTPRRAPGTPARPIEPAFSVVGGARAFAASGTDRLTASWGTHNSSINADLEGGLTVLRARSRDWCVNTDQGARYLELVADNIIGAAPPRLQVRAKAYDTGEQMDDVANTTIERAWADWCRAGQCEVTGALGFAEVCRALVQAAARDGEFLLRRVRNLSFAYGYQLQLLDVDRIDSGANIAPAQPGGNAIRLGVEINALGRKVALHLFNRHPGDSSIGLAGKGMAERVPAQNLLHGFVLKRPEQVRGYPWAAPVLRRANTLTTYEGYALEAAKVGAAKMGFYTVDKDAVNGAEVTWEQMRTATGELVQDAEAAMLEALPPGVGFEVADWTYPADAFPAFVTEYKRDIAAGLGVAHHNLSGNMAGVNYSSARIAELNERRAWRALQQWFISCCVQVVYADWLECALLKRAIVLPNGSALPAEKLQKFLAASSFQPQGWAWVDPEKDMKAAAIGMSYDMRSLRAVADEQGVDLEDTLADKAALIKRYQALDLPLPPWLGGAGATVAPASAASPAPETEPEAA
jgi:lambda family phage portal protein